MKDKIYFCSNDYDGGKSGTLSEILEWQHDNNIAFLSCEYFEVGDEIKVEDLIKG